MRNVCHAEGASFTTSPFCGDTCSSLRKGDLTAVDRESRSVHSGPGQRFLRSAAEQFECPSAGMGLDDCCEIVTNADVECGEFTKSHDPINIGLAAVNNSTNEIPHGARPLELYQRRGRTCFIVLGCCFNRHGDVCVSKIKYGKREIDASAYERV